MRLFRYSISILGVILLASCDIFLGAIGPLSQIHKNLAVPWNQNFEIYSTDNTGNSDNARVQIVERGSTVLVVYGVQYSATTLQDIKVYDGMKDNAVNMWTVFSGSTSSGMQNIFDISQDPVPVILYRYEYATNLWYYDTATEVSSLYWNTNISGSRFVFPSTAGMVYQELNGNLISVMNGPTHDTNIITTLPLQMNPIESLKSEYINGQQYLSFISKGMTSESNFLSVYNIADNSVKVDRFFMLNSLWFWLEPHHFDVAFDNFNNMYVAADGGLFKSDGGAGLIPVNTFLDLMQATNGIALDVRNNDMHLAFYNGSSIEYVFMDKESGSIYIQEPLTDLIISGDLVGLDIKVASDNTVYIGVMEYRGTDNRTFGHLLFR